MNNMPIKFETPRAYPSYFHRWGGWLGVGVWMDGWLVVDTFQTPIGHLPDIYPTPHFW